MCQSKQTENVKAPRSPWRRLFRSPQKPKLSRKIVGGAKVNLNRYWSKFEEMVVLKPEVTLDNEINENLANESREAIITKKPLL